MAQRQEPVEPVEPIGWYQALYTALARPSLSQYQKLAANPNAKLRTALTWVGIASLLAVIGFIVVSELIHHRAYGTTVFAWEWHLVMMKFLAGIGIATAIANLIAFWLLVTVQHQLLGSQNSNIGQLAYMQAASFAPTLVIGSTLTAYLRVVLIISVIALGIYALIAAKALYKRGWVRSILSVLFALVISGIFVLVIGFAIIGGMFLLWGGHAE